MRPTIILISKDPGLDGMFNVTKEQIQKLMEDSYTAGLEEGRNKALAEEYVKMTRLQMAFKDVEVSE
jgi:hypothetical protein